MLAILPMGFKRPKCQYLKPILGYFSEVGYCKIDFCNVHVELCRISIEVETTLKQKIIELIKLSATESVSDASFSSS